MIDLLTEYASLKDLEADREEYRKIAKNRYVERLAEIDNNYPDLDDNIKNIRDDIMVEARSLLGGVYESGEGKVEIQDRVSWEISNKDFLVGWLNTHERRDLWKYEFLKGEVNRICTGLDIAGMELPAGTRKLITPTLVITLPKGEPVV